MTIIPRLSGRADVLSEVLQCTKCAGKFSVTCDAIICSRCGDRVPIEDGIVDFVGNSARTKLDDIDYDDFYRVNKESSHVLIDSIIKAAGSWWQDKLGYTLEIGAGTGGGTMGLAALTSMSHLVVSDISRKMLRLCRENLNNAGLLRTQEMTFVTYGAIQCCFQPSAFDTAVGSSVIHHITDVQSFLANLSMILKPRGRAFFIEPAMPFHHAITATLADIVAKLIRDGTAYDNPKIIRVSNWIAEVGCNIFHHGSIPFLSSREDKHLFFRAELIEMAQTAGFAEVAIVPFGYDPTGEQTLRTYLMQCDVGENMIEDICRAIPEFGAKYFSKLDSEEQAPSYLLCFVNGDRTETHDYSPRFHFNVNPQRNGASVEGWCLASVPLAWVVAEVGGEAVRLPIWRPRPDVQALVNREGSYPAINALCSGVAEDIKFSKSATKPVRIVLSAVTTVGVTIPLCTIEVGEQAISIIGRRVRSHASVIATFLRTAMQACQRRLGAP